MQRVSALRQLGDTQQKLLRKLLLSPQGVTVEDLCKTLGVTHNAVRQHLTALMARGFIARGESMPSGGRPRACFVLLPAGRELFPRNYALIAQGMLEYLYAHAGTAAVQGMLTAMGTRLGEDAAMRVATATDHEAATRLLAEQLDSLTARVFDAVAANLNICVNGPLERIDPDCADAEMPMRVHRPGSHDYVAGDHEVAGKWRRAEARAEVDTTPFSQDVRDPIIDHLDIATAIDGDAICKPWRNDPVAANKNVLVRNPVRPGRNPVVADIPDFVVFNDRVANASMQVDPVGRLIGDFHLADRQVVRRTIEPQADLGVMQIEFPERRSAEPASDRREP